MAAIPAAPPDIEDAPPSIDPNRPSPFVGALHRLWDSAKGGLTWLLILTVSLVLLWVLYATAATTPQLCGSRNCTSAEKLIFGGTITLVCAIPFIVTSCLGLLASRSLNARQIYDMSRRVAVERAPSPALRPACEDAARVWRHERAQVEHTSTRLLHQALFYGFFSSVMLCVAGVVLVEPLVQAKLLTGARILHREPVCIALAAAVVTMFGRDMGRMLVRAANRDASAQMLAWATKRLLVVVTVTVLAGCLAIAGDVHRELLPRAAHWVLLGAGIAFLGDRATESVTERVAQFLGMPPRPKLNDDNLIQVDGLAEEDCARLAEEGIDGAHGLALYSTAKLFFNTPYTLQRICDWQDQALLIARIGQARARVFREQLMIRGAIDAQRVALTILEGKMGPEDGKDVRKILGFSTEPQMRIALERLAKDEVAARLLAYQAAMPSHETPGRSGGHS